MLPPFVAYLRVYEPLAAFPPAERRQWERYVDEGRAPGRDAGLWLEREHALRDLFSPSPPSHAYVMVAAGTPLVCPWDWQARRWDATADAAMELPDALLAAALPPGAVEAAAAERAAWRAEHPEARTHVLSKAYAVPVRWFVPFAAQERVLELGRRPAGATPPWRSPEGDRPEPHAPPHPHRRGDAIRALRYATSMASARRRTARALAVVRRSLDDEDVVAGLEDLGRWLEEFHPRSMLELDYGGLVHLQDDETLRADQSAADVAAALAALAEEDDETAAEAYDRVSERWRLAQLVESAN